MDERLLKRMTLHSVGIMLIVIMTALFISQSNNALIHANDVVQAGNLNDNGLGTLLNSNQANSSGNADGTNGTVQKELGDKYIIISKSNLTYDNINLEDLYLEHSISISFEGYQGGTIDGISIVRVNKGDTFYGYPKVAEELTNTETVKTSSNGMADSEKQVTDTTKEVVDTTKEATNPTKEATNPTKEATNLSKEVVDSTNKTASEKEMNDSGNEINDPVKGISFGQIEDESGNVKPVITIQLDKIYASKLYEDDKNIYIDLRRPKDVYDKIIVVDAGHGGTDPGTYSPDEKHYEKDINLSILLYLKELLDQDNIKVYYTRTSDKTVYLNPRVYLANDVEADLLVSIHCNSNESPQPSGSEVLYNEFTRADGFQSKQFAQICLEEISKVTNKVNRGLVSGEDVVIINKAKMPVALIEVGFMSNHEELNFLLLEDNKKKMATSIYKAILRAYEGY